MTHRVRFALVCCLQILFHKQNNSFLYFQFSSVAQSCPTLCDPMNRSTPGLPGHHQPPVSTQTHVHRVGDAIQFSHPLSSPSSPAPNPSQDQGLLFIYLFFYLQWILSYMEMKQPWVYLCSPSRSPLPPPSPPAPSRSSQCTRSERLSHASNLGW